MKNIVIDGIKFSDLEGFYTEIDKLLTKDLDWKTDIIWMHLMIY